MSDPEPARPREWWFTQLTLFIWAWMLVAPRLQDRWSACTPRSAAR